MQLGGPGQGNRGMVDRRDVMAGRGGAPMRQAPRMDARMAAAPPPQMPGLQVPTAPRPPQAPMAPMAPQMQMAQGLRGAGGRGGGRRQLY